MSLGLSLAVLAAAACGDDDDDGGGSTTSEATNPPSGSGGEDARVTVRDNEFDPAEVSVGVNHEVTWEWEGNNPHSIVGTFEGEDVQSPRLTGSGTFVFSFAQAGTFEYQCGVHGASMSGTVRIE
jgi:plastocyanin